MAGTGRILRAVALIGSLALTVISCGAASFSNPFDPTLPSGLLAALDPYEISSRPSIVVTNQPAAVAEGAQAAFSVAISLRPAANVTVNITTNDAALVVSPTVLTFTPDNFQISQSVTLDAVADANAANEAVTITLSAPDYNDVSLLSTTIDDEVQSFVWTGATSVVEGATAIVGLALSYEPGEDLIVSVSSTNTDALTISPSTLTFTKANFAIAQNITVTGVTDLNWVDQNVKVSATSAAVLGERFFLATDNDGPLATRVDFTDDGTSTDMAVGDFDGDGKPDVVTSSFLKTIAVFRNTSSGTGNINFAARANFSLGAGTDDTGWWNAVGDFDGDGKPDVLVTKLTKDVVIVLRNTSSGIGNVNFDAGTEFATIDRPRYVEVADMDGDGKDDVVIVSTDGSGNRVCLLRNTSSGPGNINFATAVEYDDTSTSLYLHDLDGDGKRDLLLGSFGGSLKVRRNTSSIGTLSFAATQTFTAGEFGSVDDLVAGDIDGDGKPDVVLTNGSSSISYVINTSSVGTISFDSYSDVKVTGLLTGRISLIDFFGDGKLDVVYARGSIPTPGVGILRNNSALGLGSFTDHKTFSPVDRVQEVAVADFDSDGKMDVVVQSAGTTDAVSVFRNNEQ